MTERARTNESWRRVVLVPYDPEWPGAVPDARGADRVGPERHRRRRRAHRLNLRAGAHGEADRRHPGGVRSLEPLDAYRASLENAGYEYRPDDDPEHRCFKRDENGERVVNIHVVHADSWWGRHDLLFRDYLRANPDEAARYEAIKRELASRFPDDVQAYADAKTPYIASVHAMARGDSGS